MEKLECSQIFTFLGFKTASFCFLQLFFTIVFYNCFLQLFFTNVFYNCFLELFFTIVILKYCCSDVHPDAILKVLSDSSERSPFGDPKNQAKIERHIARRKAREEETPTITRDRDRYGSRENLRYRSPDLGLQR